MRLRVQLLDGRSEILTLIPPLVAMESPEGNSGSVLMSADDTDHFFNEDGRYVGWGRRYSGIVTKEGADDAVAQYELAREFDPPTK